MAALLLAVSLIVGGYVYVASQLPSPKDLTGRAASFKSVKFFDRTGQLLYEMVDPHGGRRTVVDLDQISPYVRQATVATEDKNFYRHAGIDPVGIARALWQNLTEREIVSGASTITQQLARTVLLPSAERSERTFTRKLKEAILATELTRRYSKDTILETYLNEIYYGNAAYGIDAAAETYFGKPAAGLTLAESALLAGLPQAPAIYDPFINPEAAKKRQADVLNLMAAEGYLTADQTKSAWAVPLKYVPPERNIKAPHFVNYVRQQLEGQYGPEVLYRSGLHIYTTLDPALQTAAESIVQRRVRALTQAHVSNGALVALRPDSGEILAMVGSADFFDASIDGQVNVTLRLRQPGSAIKPVTYLAAFERGWSPSTIIVDEETSFPDGGNPDYRPVNYDNAFHGPVSIRAALANSYNIPAVKALQFVSVPNMLAMAHRLGIASLNRPDYGLSLTLGGGDVTLLELTGAYAVLANEGRRASPMAVLKLADGQGRIIEDFQGQARLKEQQVVAPELAYLITDILSDNDARTPAFGDHSPLNVGRPAAAKTGTTNDYRDNWTVGYAPDLVVGVWVGNNDNTPMRGVSGISGAAPIWHDVIVEALKDAPVKRFHRPNGVITMEVCADTGLPPDETCRQRRAEVFAASKLPAGGAQPTRHPTAAPTGGRAAILSPTSGQTVVGIVDIMGQASAADFSYFVLDYGAGERPAGWSQACPSSPAMVEGGVLCQWDTRTLPEGLYTLRLQVAGVNGAVTEASVAVMVQSGRPPIIPPEPLPGYNTPAPFPTTAAPPTWQPPASRPTALPIATGSYPIPTQAWPSTPMATHTYPPPDTTPWVTTIPGATVEPEFPPTWTPAPDEPEPLPTDPSKSKTHKP